MLQIETEKDAAYSLCVESQANDIVCPSHLCKGLFIGAMDNIDHDPLLNPLFMEQVLTSQFPSADDMGTAIEAVATAATERLDLPHSFKSNQTLK